MEEILFQLFGSLLSLQLFVLAAFYLLIRCGSRKPSGIMKNVDYRPNVAIVIPCYNEEAIIEKKLANIFDANSYGKESIKVYVVDDGSEDNTLLIAQKFKDCRNLKNLYVWKNQRKKGKASALNWVFDKIKEDVLVITDADVLWDNDTLIELITNLSDPEVGAVNGKIIIANSGDNLSTKIETLYRKTYDDWRKAESNIDSCSVFNGPLMAFRREIMEKVEINENTYADDTDLLFKTRRLNYRAVYEPKAIVYEFVPQSLRELFKQKIRRATGLTQIFLSNLSVMGRYGYFGKVIYPFSIYMHVVSPVVTLILLFLLPHVVSQHSIIMLIAPVLLIPAVHVAVIGYLMTQLASVIGLIAPKGGRWKTSNHRCTRMCKDGSFLDG